MATTLGRASPLIEEQGRPVTYHSGLDQLFLHGDTDGLLEIAGAEFVARIVQIELDRSWPDPKQVRDHIH